VTRLEENVTETVQSTFGRDGAMFEGLLGFVAQLSVALWSLVILTAVIRFVGIRVYRHAAIRRAVATTEPAPEPVSAPAPEPEPAPAPAPHAVVTPAVAASMQIRLGGPRHQRAEPRSAAPLPALAPDSVEA